MKPRPTARRRRYLEPLPRILWLCAAQVGVWIPWTVLFGGFTGALVAGLASRRSAARSSG